MQFILRPSSPIGYSRHQERRPRMCQSTKNAVNAAGRRPVHPLVEEVLLSPEDIHERVQEMGAELAIEYADKRPIIVTTLKGACIFASDLVRAIEPVPEGLEMGFIRASSYGAGTSSSGNVVLGISTLSDEDIQGRHLILVSTPGPQLRFLSHFLPIYFPFISKNVIYFLYGNTMPVTAALSCRRPTASVANIDRRGAGTSCPSAASG